MCAYCKRWVVFLPLPPQAREDDLRALASPGGTSLLADITPLNAESRHSTVGTLAGSTAWEICLCSSSFSEDDAQVCDMNVSLGAH